VVDATLVCFYFLPLSCEPVVLHSFPTRRSSDLVAVEDLPDLYGRSNDTGGMGHHPAGEGGHCPAAPLGTGGEVVGVVLIYRMIRSEEHTSELQSRFDLVCRLLLEKKNTS